MFILFTKHNIIISLIKTFFNYLNINLLNRKINLLNIIIIENKLKIINVIIYFIIFKNLKHYSNLINYLRNVIIIIHNLLIYYKP